MEKNKSTTGVSKRLFRELQELQNDPPTGCSAAPVADDDMEHWNAIIIGPDDTIYQGEIFELEITIPANYPFTPPKVRFKTNILHCNIYKKEICLDILKDKWSPSLTISKLLLSISALLGSPNPSDPLNGEIARLYLDNREEFNRQALEVMRKNREERDNECKNE